MNSAMNFGAPANWFWLLPLAGAILLLWRLKPRRTEAVVPSLVLWRALLAESPATTPHRRLRRNLLLVLQLCAVFLLTLALARPFLWGQAPAGQFYVFVLDNSATMRATDIAPSRFAAAQADARRAVQSLRPQDTAVILTASPRARLLCLPTSDPAQLRDALTAADPTDAPADLAGALFLARATIGARHGGHIQIWTDGVSAMPALAPPPSIDTRQSVIGSNHADNIAITALDARPDASGQQTVTVTVRHDGPRPHTGLTLSLATNGALIDARQIVFTGGTDTETFPVRVPPPRAIITARLTPGQDDLAGDNTASLVLTPARPVRVLLITPGDFFLQKALLALPNVQLDTALPAQLPSLRGYISDYDMIALDGEFPAALPSVNLLTINRLSAPALFTASPAKPTNVTLTDESPAHPVMQFINLAGVRVHTERLSSVPPSAQTLADSESGPLVAATDRQGHRTVSVAFSLLQTDWPLRVSFPLFISNSVDWLRQRTLPGPTLPSFLAGQTAGVTIPAGLRAVRVTRPDDSTRIVGAPLAGGVVAVSETEQVGLYHLAGPQGVDNPFAVNEDPVGSLAPKRLAAWNSPHPQAAHSLPRPIHREWWTLAALLSLLLMAAEWWFYHRRPAN